MNKTRQIVMATLLLMGFVLTGSKAKAQTNAQLFSILAATVSL